MMRVVSLGHYEDQLIGNSTWNTGDWNADGEFTTADLVLAFQDGGFEIGPRGVVASVPEPSSWTLLMLGVIGISRTRNLVTCPETRVRCVTRAAISRLARPSFR